MKNYQCKKCKVHIKSANTPNTSGCPSGSGAYHDWNNLGDVGDVNYQCKKCALLVQSKSTPNTSGCPSGSGAYHDWNKL